MELRQLTTFVAVAETGGFGRAADRLHVVQSAVSATVRGLEAELGARLFERTTRRVELSDAGRALLPEARRVLAAAAIARDAVDQVGSGLRGSVTIGTMQAQGMRALSVPALLADFLADHPDVEVSMRHPGGSARTADEVREGSLDLAFVALPPGRRPGLRLTLLAGEPMALVCSSHHPLAGRRRVELAALADEAFVDLPAGWGTHMIAERAFQAAGLTRDLAFEVNDTASVVELVRYELAIALLPPSLAAGVPDIAIVPVAGKPPTFDTFLAEPTERRQTAAATALAAMVLQRAGVARD
jgi:DNA-binding transcriptional LysR family regulator